MCHPICERCGSLPLFAVFVWVRFNPIPFSDVTIKMSNRSVAAHKIILAARSEAWNPSDPALLDTSEIDFSDLSVTAASTLVKWIYTNSVLAFSNQALVIELLGAANKFKLKELKDK